MDRRTFDECIASEDFRQLFLELNWNNSHIREFYEDIDKEEYRFVGVAEMHGFMVLTCEMANIPATAMCKRIDNKLRPHAQEYILIITQTGSTHHKWIIPVRNTEKRDIVTIEYDDVRKADFLYNKLSILNVPDGTPVTIQDIKQKVQESFAVNSEKITKDFFREFKQEHDRFFGFITGIDDHIKEDGKGKKKNRKKDWYTSVMLNRLMFCYFVQKKGFLDGDVNYLHNKLKKYIADKEEGTFFQSFYRGFLCALFHDGLNSPRQNKDFKDKYGCIPYLNGGMFDEHELEKEFTDIDIDDKAFENLFSFFDKWEWHLDTRLTASGKDINPDVLGYIFEQYINDRSAMGAYYTKEDITEHIGKNCILPFLMDKTEEKSPAAFKPNGFVWKTLRESGMEYIYDAVQKGYSDDWEQKIPDYIQQGIALLPEQHNLLDRRARWNEKTWDEFALPTEIWRETIERLQRCDTLKEKIANGEITHINDFITYNLDIRKFTEDILRKTDDHLFILHFYEALQNVTILDPTCGSGAFLFAAMNILEPLYEACIDKMETFHAENKNLFQDQLNEIEAKYSSNRQYFIFKSIILRNLYGVDIMVEATEIAKLRLFLKMVAVVEVDRHKDNMGLDPLPDIDFNIKCGNTLVGYATEKELHNSLTYGDMFAKVEFMEKIEDEMLQVSSSFKLFRDEQLRIYDDNASIKEFKTELKQNLKELNSLLNKHMYNCITDGNRPYEEWLRSHQPFHWLAEFYQIIKGNGGFDVIIGNPPYVEYSNVRDTYKVEGLKCLPSGNLYSFVIERSYTILANKRYIGMIIPISAFCTARMESFMNVISKNSANVHVSNYAERPSKLFEGAERNLSILLTKKDTEYDTTRVLTTYYYKWKSENRNLLFRNLSYQDSTLVCLSSAYPKVSCLAEHDLLLKMRKCATTLGMATLRRSNYVFYYKNSGGRYWKFMADFQPLFYLNGEKCSSSRETHLYFGTSEELSVATAILNSTLYFWYYVMHSDARTNNPSDLKDLPIDIRKIAIDNKKELCALSSKLMQELQINAVMVDAHYRTGDVKFAQYLPAMSKPIIDDIDKVLAKHYDFTEEELDFIINYDIKYRMGDELNND